MTHSKHNLPILILCLYSLIFSFSAMAYDAPWNGGREDITGPGTSPPPPCVGTDTCQRPPNPCNTKSPVYTARGTLVWQDSDIVLPASQIDITRTYNSHDRHAGIFGRGWMTAQEASLVKTFQAIDGSQTGFKSVPIWMAETGTRYKLEDTLTSCNTPQDLFFTFEKLPDGGYKQVFEDNNSYQIFNAQGALVSSYDDEEGSSQYYEYDESQRLIRQYDSYGFELNYTYNDQGFVSEVSDQGGRIWQYSYDQYGNLTQVIDPDNDIRAYYYQTIDRTGYKEHLLNQITDNDTQNILTVTWKRTTIYGHKAMRVDSYTESDGKKHTYSYAQTTYDGRKAIKTQKTTYQVNSTSAIESQTFYSDYNAHWVLKSVNNTRGTTDYTTFNEQSLVTQSIDERGNKTDNQYNEQGNLTQLTEYAGTANERVTTLTYHNNTDRVATVNEYGLRETRNSYDSDLRLTSTTDIDLTTNDQRQWRYTYHPNQTDLNGNTILGNVATIDGPQAGTLDTTKLFYNAQGLLESLINPLGQRLDLIYNSVGQLSTVTDFNGQVTQLDYDSKNQIIKSNIEGRIQAFQYDTLGQLTWQQDELGLETFIRYNPYGDLIEMELPGGETFKQIYSYQSNQTQVTQQWKNAGGQVVSQTIDHYQPRDEDLLLNEYLSTTAEVVSSHQYNKYDEVSKSTLYGQFGNTTGVTTSPTSNAYNYKGQLVQILDAINGTTTLDYDAFERLHRVTAPNNAITEYQYNALDDLLKEISADTGTTQFQYDEAGNLTQTQDANTRVVNFVYDAINRLRQIDYSDNSLDTTLTFDEGQYGQGQLTSVTDGSGASQYQYNALGLVSQASSQVSGTNLSTQYQYNNLGQLTDITYPGGMTISYHYDAYNKLAGIEQSEGGVINAMMTGVNWNGPLLTAFQHGNGLTTTMSYDEAGRLTGMNFGGNDNALNNTLDRQGQMTQQQWVRDNLISTFDYRYDLLGQLTHDGLGQSEEQIFDYDPVGNRLILTQSGVTESYQYESNSNRLSQKGIDNITLDAVGNTLNDGKRTYQYNEMNRLAQVTDLSTGIIANYQYNYLGQRVQKQVSDVGSTHIIYSYGPEGELLGEYDAFGNRIREYVYLREGETPELVAMVDANGQIFAVHTDHLGTPRLVTDNNKTIVWRWVSDAFGNGAANEDVDGNGEAVTLNHRFAGQYFDEESGIYYNYYRYYDPQTGRYVTSDPIGLEAGLNTYGYALQSPLNYNDPTGEIVPALIAAGRLGYMAYKGYKKYKQARKLVKRAKQVKQQRKQKQLNPKSKGTKGKKKTKCSSKKGNKKKDIYKRPTGFRKGVRDKVWEKAKGPDGLVRDPKTQKVIKKGDKWDMGHKPGYEFRKHSASAKRRKISRKKFLDEHNNPNHYRPELPSSNRSHSGELPNNIYYGP